jgi:ATP-dependent Clp protease adaptor protein ClpS
MTPTSYDALPVRGHRARAIRVNSVGRVVDAPQDPPVGVGTIDVVPTTLEPVQVEEPDLADETEPDRPWIVLVWNDPINLMSYVTHVFQKLFGYSLEKATELMLDVHEKGRAVVASGSREEAEMHVFRLHEHSLWATMEHDR